LRKGVRQRRADLVAAAIRLARAIGTEDCVLIGGLAVGVHGYVRATDDLDFISRLSLDRTRERLRQAGIEARLLRGEVLEAGFSCLKGEIDGIPFDILPPLVPIAWEGAVTLDFGRDKLRVVDLDGLLRLKLRAAGPQDLLDAAHLVLRHPGTEARARELATAYRALDRFEMWLTDPRMRVHAREQAEMERRSSRKAGEARTPARREVRGVTGKRGPRRGPARKR
jgi:hypothetical protein